MIRTESLGLRVGNRDLLADVTIEIGRGDVLAIIGPSGSGKSTFLRCMNGLAAITAGKIAIGDFAIGAAARLDVDALRRLRKSVGFVFQGYNLFPHLTALENVALAPRHVLKLSRADAERRALELLDRVGLAARAHQRPATLSGGEQQRVAIARALAMQPEVLLLDEPTAALDPELTDEVLAVLRRLAADGQTMIVVTHEMRFARDVASRVLVLDGGRVVEIGPPHEVFTSPREERTRRFLARVLPPGGR